VVKAFGQRQCHRSCIVGTLMRRKIKTYQACSLLQAGRCPSEEKLECGDPCKTGSLGCELWVQPAGVCVVCYKRRLLSLLEIDRCPPSFTSLSSGFITRGGEPARCIVPCIAPGVNVYFSALVLVKYAFSHTLMAGECWCRDRN
jgi:hypothetical protein